MAAANWQRAGKKSTPKPKPLSPTAKKRPGQIHYGKTDRSPEEVKALLARYGPRRTDADQPLAAR